LRDQNTKRTGSSAHGYVPKHSNDALPAIVRMCQIESVPSEPSGSLA
jgi:hypothetical protein